MKKKQIKKHMMKVLFAAVMVSGLSVYISCNRNDTAQLHAPTAIVQLQNQSGTSFNYEVFFEPIVEFHGSAFPANILSTATMNSLWDGSPRMETTDYYIGDRLGDFGVTLSLKGSSGGTIPVRIEIEGDRFIRKSGLDAVVPLNREIEIFPRIAYDYQALERLTQPAVENVYFRLFYGSVPLLEKMEVVSFHSVNEVPFRVTNRRDGSVMDYTWLFAAYVNEDDPLIDEILKEALQIGTAEKIGFSRSDVVFDGYQREVNGDSSLAVDLQVMALWSVFLNRNIKYSSITTTSTENSNIFTQYVRTLGESLTHSQANCVDGSVLFASVLRKIGIHPFLVIIPGHMFLAYLQDDEPFSMGFLETTMMGNTDVQRYTRDDSFFGRVKRFTGLGQTQSTATRDSFLAAKAVGDNLFDEVREKILDEEDTDHILLDISALRSAGVMPIRRY